MSLIVIWGNLNSTKQSSSTTLYVVSDLTTVCTLISNVPLGYFSISEYYACLQAFRTTVIPLKFHHYRWLQNVLSVEVLEENQNFPWKFLNILTKLEGVPSINRAHLKSRGIVPGKGSPRLAVYHRSPLGCQPLCALSIIGGRPDST